jgi:hypothetical protein
MIRFYDHPHSGKLYFRADAGGGMHATSEYDAPATAADIKQHAEAYDQYVKAKTAGKLQIAPAGMDRERDKDRHIDDLKAQLAKALRTIERLNAEKNN